MANANCRRCKEKNCEYRNKVVEGYTIFTSEHCCKQEVETTKEVIYSRQFEELLEMLEDKHSNNVDLLIKQLETFAGIGLNKVY